MANPAGMQSGFRVNVLAGGMVAIEMVSGGVAGPTVTMPAKDIGQLVATLLMAARASGDPSPPVEGQAMDWLPVRPTTVSLGSSPEPNCEGLVLGFGPTLLGISLQRSYLKQLGQAMHTMSAEGEAQ
jgi:hypothetical protein